MGGEIDAYFLCLFEVDTGVEERDEGGMYTHLDSMHFNDDK